MTVTGIYSKFKAKLKMDMLPCEKTEAMPVKIKIVIWEMERPRVRGRENQAICFKSALKNFFSLGAMLRFFKDGIWTAICKNAPKATPQARPARPRNL